MLANAKSALILYGPMVARGEHGKAVSAALTNLALYTGHYERLAYIGVDANSQGCRDLGVLPNRLPGHVALDDTWRSLARTNVGRGTAHDARQDLQPDA